MASFYRFVKVHSYNTAVTSKICWFINIHLHIKIGKVSQAVNCRPSKRHITTNIKICITVHSFEAMTAPRVKVYMCGSTLFKIQKSHMSYGLRMPVELSSYDQIYKRTREQLLECHPNWSKTHYLSVMMIQDRLQLVTDLRCLTSERSTCVHHARLS